MRKILLKRRQSDNAVVKDYCKAVERGEKMLRERKENGKRKAR